LDLFVIAMSPDGILCGRYQANPVYHFSQVRRQRANLNYSSFNS
jgi:hypothetical protein